MDEHTSARSKSGKALMRLLIAAHDGAIGDTLLDWLRLQAHVVHRTLQEVHRELDAREYDAAILVVDLSIPNPCHMLVQLRSHHAALPVIAVTSSDSAADRICCLEAGAHDCVSDPFYMSELEARIRALVRRKRGFTGVRTVIGELQLDPGGRRALVNDTDIQLSAGELAILEILAERLGRIVSTDALVNRVYPSELARSRKAIAIHVCRLRKKLSGARISITTVRGSGYLLEPLKPKR
jgi:DNA-binding response OmpR family regulator